jgi:hypothetical protein
VRPVYIDVAEESEAVAAVKKLRLVATSRAICVRDLETMHKPAILILEESIHDGIEADHIGRMRRDYTGGIRHSLIVVLADRSNFAAWRQAGAHPVARNAKRGAISAALKEAIDGANHWIVSTVYVGPCRRRHKALVPMHRRRRADRPGKRAAASAGNSNRVSVSAPPGTLISRLRVAAVCLSGAPIEQREHFINLSRELAASVSLAGRHDLGAEVSALIDEARAIARDQHRPSDRVVTLLEDLSRAL